jgi:hypothetical protein
VLEQRAAEGHVRDLQATADGKGRDRPLGHQPGEVQLGPVAIEVDPVDRRMAAGPVAVRGDVSPSDEEHPVDLLQ